MTTLGTSPSILSVSCKPPEDVDKNEMYLPACSYFPVSLNRSLLPWEKCGDTLGMRWLKGPFPCTQLIPCTSHMLWSSPTQKNLLSNPGSSFLAFKERKNPPTCERILLSTGGNLYFVSYRKWENFQPWN